jgi:hypothetical protein
VSPSLCAEWVAAACQENSIDLQDSATWPHRNNFISAGLSGEMAELAPKLYASIVQLVGGAELLREPALKIDSGLVANWDRGADSPWVEPAFANEYEWKSGGECGGWHSDGDFNHFVDSPEAVSTPPATHPCDATGSVILVGGGVMTPHGGTLTTACNYRRACRCSSSGVTLSTRLGRPTSPRTHQDTSHASCWRTREGFPPARWAVALGCGATKIYPSHAGSH